MVKNNLLSQKHLAVSKTNTQIIIILSVASVVTVFSLMAARSLWAEHGHQAHVIAAQQKASDQLTKDQQAVTALMDSYNQFVNTQQNIIGGVSNGTGARDGDNAKIVLDSLPTTYDFPALAASLEKIMQGNTFALDSITGTDDQVNQQTNGATGDPQPVEIPFSLSTRDSNYEGVKDAVGILERSIRPIQVLTLSVKGGGQQMTLDVTAQTYYQPAKTFSVTNEDVK